MGKGISFEDTVFNGMFNDVNVHPAFLYTMNGEQLKEQIEGLFFHFTDCVKKRKAKEETLFVLTQIALFAQMGAIEYALWEESISLGEKIDHIRGCQCSLYKRKNKDYGNSFDRSLDEDGLIVAKIRMGDKVNRIRSLTGKNEMEVNDETLFDTYIDLSNYAFMTIRWINDKTEENETDLV